MRTQLQTLPEIREQIWHELVRASRDRHHAWRKPVLATCAEDGIVNARTVVLRQVDVVSQLFVIYTDSRSSKVSELLLHPQAILVFWSDRLSWQLRVKVTVSVNTAGALVDAAWRVVSQSAAADDYLGLTPPGSLLGPEKGSSETRSNLHHFAVLDLVVIDIDWLELSRTGHRRARFSADSCDWLNP